MKVESVRRSWLDRVMCVSRRVEVELSCGDRSLMMTTMKPQPMGVLMTGVVRVLDK
jgi:hypothetical protein